MSHLSPPARPRTARLPALSARRVAARARPRALGSRTTGVLGLLLLVWLLAARGGFAQSARPLLLHHVLAISHGQTLAQLATFHDADPDATRQSNGLPLDTVLKDGQLVVLSIPAAAAAAQGALPTTVAAAAPGQTLAGLAERLGAPGVLLSDLNGLALDHRLFPGQPVVVPNPVTARRQERIGQLRVEYLTPLIRQGNLGFVALTAPSGVRPQVIWQGQVLRLSPIPAADTSEKRFLAPVPVHPLLEEGAWPLQIGYEDAAGQAITASLTTYVFEPQTFRHETIYVSDEIAVQLEGNALEEEQETLDGLWHRFSPGPWPSADWQRPIAAHFGVSSDFGHRRRYVSRVPYPVNFHSGLDFGAPDGIPVTVAAAGAVVWADALATKGLAVVVDHGQGVLSGYWHLDHISVQVGEIVPLGHPIGSVGNTGLSTGSHLHWEMRVQGVPVNPAQFLTAPLLPPGVLS